MRRSARAVIWRPRALKFNSGATTQSVNRRGRDKKTAAGAVFLLGGRMAAPLALVIVMMIVRVMAVPVIVLIAVTVALRVVTIFITPAWASASRSPRDCGDGYGLC